MEHLPIFLAASETVHQILHAWCKLCLLIQLQMIYNPITAMGFSALFTFLFLIIPNWAEHMSFLTRQDRTGPDTQFCRTVWILKILRNSTPDVMSGRVLGQICFSVNVITKNSWNNQLYNCKHSNCGGVSSWLHGSWDSSDMQPRAEH